jgi:hypothetical protein
MTTKIDDLITKMEFTRNQLNAIMEKATPQVDIYPSWNLKRLMDHITGWDELVVSAFRTHSQGETPEMVVMHGIDQFNAQSVSAREELSFDSSRHAYDTARVDLLKVVRAMPVEKLTQKFPAPWGGLCTVTSVLRVLISHESEHAQHLEEKLTNPDYPP